MLKQEKYCIKCLQKIGEKLTEAKDYAAEKLGMCGDEKSEVCKRNRKLNGSKILEMLGIRSTV
jgi:hypothetical protein